MAAQSRIIALNIGMQTIRLAEFHAGAGGSLTLHALSHEDLIVDPAADATRPTQIQTAVDTLRKKLQVSKRERANVCLPSQTVFTRFVKLPGTAPSEVDSVIGFEAQQNVPFPIDEVIWDYQIMGEPKENIWDVALVAIKADQLDEINSSVSAGGIKSFIVDVAPMALSNAFRYNYSELSGCSLLIDIGARTTNLVFVENKRVFSRSIPLGGSSLSAAIAKEFKREITVAERLKIQKGLVGLGGNYAEPENPVEARIAKIIRGTMTRLHAEVARSISFYRQNQSGSAPVRAFLCGGTINLPYMVEFFSEKLQMPIEHFNPLRNVLVSSPELAAQVGDKAHALGEVVGCAVRSLANTPMEINLRPQSVIREQHFARRKPFLLVAASCLLLMPVVWWLYFSRGTAIAHGMLEEVSAQVRQLESVAKGFDALEVQAKQLQEIAAPILQAIADRSAWAEILEELGTRLPPRFIWITEIKALSGGRPYLEGIIDSSSASAQQKEIIKTSSSPSSRQQSADGQSKIEALEVSGLYLANPPNEKEARVIDEFVDRLKESKVFKVEEKDKAKVVIQRTTPDGQSWAYGYTIVLPLRDPISLP